MKYTLMTLCLCLIMNSAKAQDTVFEICIADPDRIINYSSGVPEFDDPDINNIFGNYTITYFAKSSPLSGYEYLRKWYEVHCDSIGLAEELYAYDSLLFSEYRKKDTGMYLAHFPSDWNSTHNDTDMFNFIKAPGAWGVSTGDTSMIIGVVDGGFNLAHPDMNGKYARVKGPNQLITQNHGSFVAGLIAANTDNGSTGTTGMGYDCRLHVYAGKETNDAHNLAMDTNVVKTRVLSLSWVEPPFNFTTAFDPLGNIGYYEKQQKYHELYERGIVTVCAAGNGTKTDPNGPPINPGYYLYPAAYNHALSVTSVGHLNTSGTKNIQYMHEYNVGDSSSDCYQHNYRVDLSAPGHEVSSHYNDPFNSKYYSYRENSGSSFSAPLVAGTVGLMLSKRPWFTPYQVEYILKKSSVDIYNLTYNSIAYNQRYAGPTRWTGRLGAGTLDAEAALQMTDVDSFFQDHPDAHTFRIKGVKLNTKCVPGIYQGVPDPKIEVIMENGTPPYTYKWEEMTNQNGANISPMTNSVGTNNIVATVTSMKNVGGNPYNYFGYRLTVYDNSDIQKVASKIVNFKMYDNPIWDLAMQDAYADLYDEPNLMQKRSVLDWDIWTSPDIWNRINQDNDTAHQDPDHSAIMNYMHVRVKNIGCVESPNTPDSASLAMYWTIASTGEWWPNDWVTGGSQINNLPAGGTITSANGIPIPPISPGGELILSHGWTPPVPQDYDSTIDRMAVCALARILGNQGPPYGMAFPEIDTTKVNVRNNNNIVTRNFETINLNPPGPVVTPVVIGNPSGGGTGGNPPKGTGVFTVQLITENQLQPYIHGHLASYMDMVLHLGDLYDIWSDGGNIGNPTSFSEMDRTVTWDMQQPLRLDNIELDEGERYMIKLEFRPKGLASVPYEVNNLLHLRLVSPDVEYFDNGDGTSIAVNVDKVHSAVNYAVHIASTEAGESKKGRNNAVGSVGETKPAGLAVYPNPVSGELTVMLAGKGDGTNRIIVTDISGKVVYENESAVFSDGKFRLETGAFAPGAYQVQVIDGKGMAFAQKFIKLDK